MLLKTGTTTVADIEAMPDLLPEVWDATPLRVFSFLEMTGIRAKRAPKEILHEAVKKIDSLAHARNRAVSFAARALLHSPGTAPADRRNRAQEVNGASPSTSPSPTRNLRCSCTRAARCTTGSSATTATIPIAATVRPSPISRASRLLGENVLAVHVNCLARGDATLLGKNRTHVVHCPRSHDYFHHPPFSRERLANAGVNLCLGTDSLATTRKTGKQKPELNMFEEMRMLADTDKAISPLEILRMATVNGARALGLAGETGELSKNAFADLIADSFRGKKSADHPRNHAHARRQRGRQHD